MTHKKKIGIVNLQVDSNYGGHLQRYALMQVLQRMGYKPIHINLRRPWEHKSVRKRITALLKLCIKLVYYTIIKCDCFSAKKEWLNYQLRKPITDKFYNKHIKHTRPIYDKNDLKKYADFPIYIVGSDQVWRYEYANPIFGIETYFLGFIPVTSQSLRIAYGASFGSNYADYPKLCLGAIGNLINKMNSISVREESAIQIMSSYGWETSDITSVLDPTLLLTSEDYESILEPNTSALDSDIFCYILDSTEYKTEIIQNISEQLKLSTHILSENERNLCSIEQWLRYFKEAKVVITDSYHGMLFSIIFKKTFKVIINNERGAARFYSVADALGFNIDEMVCDYNIIDKNLSRMRFSSIDFLHKALVNV